MHRPFSHRTLALAKAGLVALVVLAADQLSKAAVIAHLASGQDVHLLPGLDLVHIANTGVAFSLFAGAGAALLVVTFAVMAALVWFLAAHPQRRALWLASGMFLGGALGNLADRVSSGAVTDFIKLPHWPVFNVADISITLAVFVLAFALGAFGEKAAPETPSLES